MGRVLNVCGTLFHVATFVKTSFVKHLVKLLLYISHSEGITSS